MNLALNPEIQRLIADQVKAGRYATPEAVVEAAVVEKFDSSSVVLDDETIAAINEGGAQADRGEGIELEVFREQWKKRLGNT